MPFFFFLFCLPRSADLKLNVSIVKTRLEVKRLKFTQGWRLKSQLLSHFESFELYGKSWYFFFQQLVYLFLESKAFALM